MGINEIAFRVIDWPNVYIQMHFLPVLLITLGTINNLKPVNPNRRQTPRATNEQRKPLGKAAAKWEK